MNALKNQLTMRGVLRRCWLFSYRTPSEAVRHLVPEPLQLITTGGFAFWNIVFCNVEKLRPAPMPACLGISYWHVAYRLLVAAPAPGGQRIPGLYFLRSHCDLPWMAAVGNCLTDFKFRPAQIGLRESDTEVNGTLEAPDCRGSFQLDRQIPPELSAGSPFVTLDEAASFLKYEPCAMSPRSPHSVQCLRVKRDENQWQSRLVTARHAQWSFLDESAAQLELCWEIDPIDYQWNRAVNIKCL